MTALAEASVDLDAIAHNTAVLARAAGGAHLMAVVKANGFGHGATRVARTALTHGATWLGVTTLDEALSLRADGVTAPILMWLWSPTHAVDRALTAGVDVSVGSTTALTALTQAAHRTGLRAFVHLKADTGLSRGGAPPDRWRHLCAAAAQAQAAGLVTVRGVWSHLADAEHPADPGLRRQLRAFDEARAGARVAGLGAPLTHLANSAAALQLPETHFDLVRAGIALYGVEPVPGRHFGLRPAMTVRATIVLTKRVPAGTPVSYGAEHVTDRETTLALVPMGFADGVPRLGGGHGRVGVHGVGCPVVGRVAMDQIVVDVGDLPVREGDSAVLFGPGTHGEPTVVHWAGWARTNAHEILTGIGARVRRAYPVAAGGSSSVGQDDLHPQAVPAAGAG
ncbi:alanine racemase [Micromonosporaceae bacterium Da 78-11]